MASLYSGLNTRRVGRGAGSADEGLDWSSDGVDTRTGSPILPSRSGTPHSHGVSHNSLTERGLARMVLASGWLRLSRMVRACCQVVWAVSVLPVPWWVSARWVRVVAS